MSVLSPDPIVTPWVFGLGYRYKTAEEKPAYNMVGLLYLAANGWLVLGVPNGLVNGVFAAMDEPGIELPPGTNGRFDAHIAVMSPDELQILGGPDRITERGKQYHYTLGRLIESDDIPESAGGGVSKTWAIRIHSPDLQTLRRSYGLTSLPEDGNRDFAALVAVRKRGVLGRNEKAKE